MIIFVSVSVENIVGKEENGGYQQFLLFPQYFQKTLIFQGHIFKKNFIFRSRAFAVKSVQTVTIPYFKKNDEI